MIYGYECIIDAKKCSNINRQSLKNFVIELCELLCMKRYRKCQVVYFGKDRFKGYSIMQFITTSSIVGHFTKDEAYINIFSCKKFNENEVVNFVRNWFYTDKINTIFLRR